MISAYVEHKTEAVEINGQTILYYFSFDPDWRAPVVADWAAGRPAGTIYFDYPKRLCSIVAYHFSWSY